MGTKDNPKIYFIVDGGVSDLEEIKKEIREYAEENGFENYRIDEMVLKNKIKN